MFIYLHTADSFFCTITAAELSSYMRDCMFPKPKCELFVPLYKKFAQKQKLTNGI